MNQILNHMFLAANRAAMNIGYSHLGIITSVNPVDYTVKVLLQPEEIETGFIPYCTPFYGWVAPPSGGEQCLVLFERGNNNVPIAALLLYWDGARAPGASSPGDTGAGEILLRHSSGAYIKLNSDGSVILNSVEDITLTATTNVTITAPQINLNGNVTVSGNLTANNGAISMNNGVITTNENIVSSKDMVASGISLKDHVHSGVTSGSSNTGAPVT